MTYLALGDSYTIGEGLPATDNFPHQLAALLRRHYPDLTDPVVIATTGWTTSELEAAIQERKLQQTFSLVTLLIGVNNQYRGQTLDTYTLEFEALLGQAIAFAGNDAARVLVLSIPDWGRTPYAEGRDRAKIAREIDAFNAVNRKLSEARNVAWLDITGISRAYCNPDQDLVADGLHYSAAHYRRWAEAAAALLGAIRAW